jgi:hypothetical protein
MILATVVSFQTWPKFSKFHESFLFPWF